MNAESAIVGANVHRPRGLFSVGIVSSKRTLTLAVPVLLLPLLLSTLLPWF